MPLRQLLPISRQGHRSIITLIESDNWRAIAPHRFGIDGVGDHLLEVAAQNENTRPDRLDDERKGRRFRLLIRSFGVRLVNV